MKRYQLKYECKCGGFVLTSQSEEESNALVMLYEALAYTGLVTLTWKDRATPAGRLIPALRASVRRTSDKGCTGWPTASTRDWKDTPGMATKRKDGRSRLDQLPRVAHLAGWPTAAHSDGERGGTGITAGMSGRSLTQMAKMAGWATPNVEDSKLDNWTTKTLLDAVDKSLPIPTTAQRLRSFVHLACPARLTVAGEMQIGSSAEMGIGGQLNPAHSRWLMGLPRVWASCAATAMQSLPTKRKCSLKATSMESDNSKSVEG